MKKIIIAILIILLISLTYIMLAKSINIGSFKIESIKDIKLASNNLEENVNKANSLSDQTYPKEITSLEEAIKELKRTKETYESKNYNTTGTAPGTVEIDTYKIHYLWTKLGNYRKDRGVISLNIDLRATQNNDIYDLEFTAVGEYSSIIEFLYDIEDDEELKFEINDFNMEPYRVTTQTTIIDGDTNKKTSENKTSPYETITQIQTSQEAEINTNTTTTNTTTSTNTNTSNTNNTNASTSQTIIYDPKWVEASFTVKGVGVTLD